MQTEVQCMQMLLNALRDPEVPVVVYASMSLGFFISRESRTTPHASAHRMRDGTRDDARDGSSDGTHPGLPRVVPCCPVSLGLVQ